jgi:hypothetical protein
MREDPNYNQRQYDRTLKRIELYRNGELSLPKLIDDLRGLIWALESVSREWRNTLIGNWSPLELAYANALYEKRKTLNDEGRGNVAEALDDLERIIKSRGPESNSLIN